MFARARIVDADLVRFLSRSALVLALIAGVGVTTLGCDDHDREPNRADVVLRPGESALLTFQITVDESEEADFLVSCDFADIVAIDPENLAAEVEDPGKSGSFECAAHVSIAALPDARPGEYQLTVRFNYTYFEGGIGEDDTDGYIRVIVAE